LGARLPLAAAMTGQSCKVVRAVRTEMPGEEAATSAAGAPAAVGAEAGPATRRSLPSSWTTTTRGTDRWLSSTGMWPQWTPRSRPPDTPPQTRPPLLLLARLQDRLPFVPPLHLARLLPRSLQLLPPLLCRRFKPLLRQLLGEQCLTVQDLHNNLLSL
jgi:hypothetical protein